MKKEEMVFREKDFLRPPAKLMLQKWNKLKRDLLVRKHLHDIQKRCYRDTTLDELSTLYKHKCAICERDRGTELHVDHYRPKKPRHTKINSEYDQPGYYWLAYSWSNLIPLCSKCNISKSNKFPLNGWNEQNRISDLTNINGFQPFHPYDLAWLQEKEKPLLINPEYEKIPESHFAYKNNGKVVGRTEEGKETIKICQLNRKDLVRERLKIRHDYVTAIKSAFDDFNRTKNKDFLKGELGGIFKTMKTNCHPDEGHSLYNLYIFKYFEYFIDSKLPPNLKGVAIKYFNQFNS